MESEFVILIVIVAFFSGLAIFEGYSIDTAFYSMAVIIWITFGYFVLAFGRSTPAATT